MGYEYFSKRQKKNHWIHHVEFSNIYSYFAMLSFTHTQNLLPAGWYLNWCHQSKLSQSAFLSGEQKDTLLSSNWALCTFPVQWSILGCSINYTDSHMIDLAYCLWNLWLHIAIYYNSKCSFNLYVNGCIR